MTQPFMQTIKSKRQVNYQPHQLHKSESYITRETPLSVGLRLHIYLKTRSKILLDVLFGLHLTVLYEKICSIKNDLVTHAEKEMSENGEMYVPPSLSPNTSLYFVIDYVDFQIDTPDGKEQLHGTTQVLFQEKDPNWNKNILECFKRNTPKNTENVYNIIYCAKPKSRNETYLAYEDFVNYDKVNQYKFGDIAWTLSRTTDLENSFQLSLLIVLQLQRLPSYQSILQRQSYTIVRRIGQISILL